MRRGELYLVQHPSSRDPRRQRVFVIVSRELLVKSSFSSLICAPVYTRRDGLYTQVEIGIEEGLKHESSIHCDELISLPKSSLTNFIGYLPPAKQAVLDRALAFALGLTSDTFPEGAQRIRLDRDREASHDLNRLLDEPGPGPRVWAGLTENMYWGNGRVRCLPGGTDA